MKTRNILFAAAAALLASMHAVFAATPVAVWDGDNSATRKAMETLGMKWNQIFAGEDKTPTEVYGIEGIPHIILFGPDGTICRRNLRGQEMIEAVKSVVK